MKGETMNDQETATLPQLCEKHGVTIESRFIGLRETPAETKATRPWKHFLWSVTLKRGSQMIDTPWKAGIGHAKKGFDDNVALARESQRTGTPLISGRETQQPGDKLATVYLPTPPIAADVLHSLILDSSACDMSFEDWCADYGYDTDSRKALDTYIEYQNIGNKVRAFLGREFSEFQIAAQEY